MKQKRTFSVWKTIIAIVVVLIVVLFFWMKLRENNLAYSFKNRGFLGAMLYYDVLKELDYKVSYSINEPGLSKDDRLLVINCNGSKAPEEENIHAIEEIAMAGGHVMVFGEQYADTFVEHLRDHQVYNDDNTYFDQWDYAGGGVIMLGSIDPIMNLSVSFERESAYEVLEIMHPYMAEHGVIFNEHYLFAVAESYTLWHVIPTRMKYVLLQLLLAFVLYVIYRGKRFGAPSVYYEESEHSENAYALAVGELFYRAKHYDVLLESYFNDLIEKLRKKHFIYGVINVDNFVDIYKERHKKDYKRALMISNVMHKYYVNKAEDNKGYKLKDKEIKEALMNIQKLESQLDKEEF